MTNTRSAILTTLSAIFAIFIPINADAATQARVQIILGNKFFVPSEGNNFSISDDSNENYVDLNSDGVDDTAEYTYAGSTTVTVAFLLTGSFSVRSIVATNLDFGAVQEATFSANSVSTTIPFNNDVLFLITLEPANRPISCELAPDANTQTGAPVLWGQAYHTARRATIDPTDPNYPLDKFSGDFMEKVVDLHVPGRGLDFVFSRYYHSNGSEDSLLANDWDHSYNIYHTNPDDSFPFRKIELSMGNGHSIIFEETGGFTNVFFADGWGARLLYDDSKLEWGDGTIWHFDSDQKIEFITDRHGNQLSFSYDGSGRLNIITDTLSRQYDLNYTAEGYIDSLSELNGLGRVIDYSHYDSEAGGNDGDLKSVNYPAISGTPTGNDFSSGRSLVYVYTKTSDFTSQLRGDLLTIQDGAGNVVLTNTYDSESRVTQQEWGVDGASDAIVSFDYPTSTAELEGSETHWTIVNDGEGNVTEFFYDSQNRVLREVVYSGRAEATNATTDTANRPLASIRSGDPATYTTRYEWDDHDLVTKITKPAGNYTEIEYTDTFVRKRDVNIEEIREYDSSDTLIKKDAYTHKSGWVDVDFHYLSGCRCGETFIETHTTTDETGMSPEIDFQIDREFETTQSNLGFGNVTGIDYTALGAGVDETFAYNSHGQLTTHTHPDNGSSHNRIDLYEYFSSGTQNGYLKIVTVDDGGLVELPTSYRYDAVGNVTAVIPPKGHGDPDDMDNPWRTKYTYNSNDELIRVQSRVPDSGIVRHKVDYIYDANGNVTDIKVENNDSTGADLPNAEIVTTYAYDSLNRVISLTQEIDASTTAVTEYTLNRNGLPILIESPEATAGNQPNNRTILEYDTRNLLYRQRRGHGDQLQRTIQFDYDPNGNLTTRTDGLEAGDDARETTYAYDGIDRLQTITDPEDNTTTYTYDGANRRTQVVIKEDGTTTLAQTDYTYDNSGRLQLETRAHFDSSGTNIGDGAIYIDYEYTDTSQIQSIRHKGTSGELDSVANGLDYTYDGALRTATVTDTKGNVTTYAYDDNGNVASITQLDKSDVNPGTLDQTFITLFEYDQLDRRKKSLNQYSSTGPSYNEVEYAYDSRNNIELVIGAREHDTNFTYDGLNRRTTSFYECDPGVIVIDTATTYDLNSRTTSRTDPNDNTTLYFYDIFDRPTDIFYADNSSEFIQYNRFGDAILHLQPSSTVVEAEYDDLGRPTQRTSTPVATDTYVNPGVEMFEYDGLSRVTLAKDGDSQVDITYTSLNQIESESQKVGGNTHTTQHSYNEDGTRSQLIYPGSRTLDYSRNALDLVTSIEESAVPLVSNQYIGRRHQRRTFADGASRLDIGWNHSNSGNLGVGKVASTLHSVLPGLGVIDSRDYTHDADGNKTQRDDNRTGGLTHDYTIDGCNRMTDSFDGTATINYDLDPAGNFGSSLGFILGGGDEKINNYSETPSGVRDYDANGNLMRFNAWDAWYVFDTHNRLVKFVIGGSRQQDDFITIPTAYDTANASGTWAVADEKLSDTSNAPARLLRDLPADTERFAFTYESPNDPANTTDYDPEQYGLGIIRLEKPDAGNGNHYRYAAIVIEPTALYLREWKDDQVVAEHGSHIADSEPNTQYDIEITYSNGPELRDISVKWGKRGEPLEEIITGELDADLALDPAHVVGFGDGSEGDYKFADVTFYRTTDTSPSTEVTFAYDALGRRIQKVAGGSTTNYYYAGPHVIEERDGSDNVTATYVYGSGIDEIISMTRGGTDYYYHTDDLGNVMAITDDSGAVVERYAYGDYGAVSYFDGSDNPISTTAIGNPLLFNGRRYDEETDLYYYRTRYMDPSVGRFISRDTIGQWGDPNNHGNGQAYVGNNPWTNTDPFGEGPLDWYFAAAEKAGLMFAPAPNLRPSGTRITDEYWDKFRASERKIQRSNVDSELRSFDTSGLGAGTPDRNFVGYSEAARFAQSKALDAAGTAIAIGTLPVSGPAAVVIDGGYVVYEVQEAGVGPELIAGIVLYKVGGTVYKKYKRAASSRRLARNLEHSGFIRKANYEAHHLVPGGDKRFQSAIRAREILLKYDIDIDSAVNGVFLPGPKVSGKPTELFHSTLNNERYSNAVVDLLEATTSRADAEAVLGRIRRQLLEGSFEF